jgi:hypothetical protein
MDCSAHPELALKLDPGLRLAGRRRQTLRHSPRSAAARPTPPSTARTPRISSPPSRGPWTSPRWLPMRRSPSRPSPSATSNASAPTSPPAWPSSAEALQVVTAMLAGNGRWLSVKTHSVMISFMSSSRTLCMVFSHSARPQPLPQCSLRAYSAHNSATFVCSQSGSRFGPKEENATTRSSISQTRFRRVPSAVPRMSPHCRCRFSIERLSNFSAGRIPR